MCTNEIEIILDGKKKHTVTDYMSQHLTKIAYEYYTVMITLNFCEFWHSKLNK